MRRYMLFAGENFYPLGGWEDFKGFFDTPENALEYLCKGELPEWITDPKPDDEDSRRWVQWAHIVDTQNMVIVKEWAGDLYAPNFREKPTYNPPHT